MCRPTLVEYSLMSLHQLKNLEYKHFLFSYLAIFCIYFSYKGFVRWRHDPWHEGNAAKQFISSSFDIRNLLIAISK